MSVVQQGSALSPVLYNVCMSKQAELQIPRGRIPTFADGILVYTHGSDRQELDNEIDHTLEEITAWCNETGSVTCLSAANATSMWRSIDNPIVNKNMPEIALGKGAFERVKFKYLGITFDRTPSFIEHVDYTVKRRIKSLNAMKVMVGAQMERKLLLMRKQTLDLLVPDYGLELIIIKHSQLQRLERIQYEAMWTNLGCTRMTRRLR